MGRIQQLNLHHCAPAAAEIGKIGDSLYLLQEPYYIKGRPQVPKPANFHSKKGSRAAIYASSLQSFSFVPMHQYTDDDISVALQWVAGWHVVHNNNNVICLNSFL